MIFRLHRAIIVMAVMVLTLSYRVSVLLCQGDICETLKHRGGGVPVRIRPAYDLMNIKISSQFYLSLFLRSGSLSIPEKKRSVQCELGQE
jgi:hypothetical protein